LKRAYYIPLALHFKPWNSRITFTFYAPHPNAAKVFINWLLSREGQIALQKAINSPTDQLESLREDISKDVINPEFRRKKGAKYIITDRPEWMNLKPVYKFINKALAEARKM